MECCQCCDFAPIDLTCLSGGNNRNVAIAALAAGITMLVCVMLAGSGVFTLDPKLSLAMTALGSGFTFFATRELGPNIGTAERKTLTIMLQIVGILAVTFGSLGLGGSMPLLRGSAGAFLAGSGAILLLANYTTYYCNFPYRVLS